MNVTEWEDPEALEIVISVVFVLPSGVQSFVVSVQNGSEYLCIDGEWPPFLSEMKPLHSKWLKGSSAPARSLYDRSVTSIEAYHPRILNAMKSLKTKRARVNDKIRSVARIPLPNTASAQISSENHMEYEDSPGAKVVYVALKVAQSTDYNVEHKLFELF